METIDQEEERISREISKENQARQTWEERQHQALANQWEQAARAAKVAKLVSHIDAVAASCGCDDVVTLEMLTQGGLDWKSLAADAGVKVPSETTVRAVVAVYEGRVKP